MMSQIRLPVMKLWGASCELSPCKVQTAPMRAITKPTTTPTMRICG
jgi:hypothetical protein